MGRDCCEMMRDDLSRAIRDEEVTHDDLRGGRGGSDCDVCCAVFLEILWDIKRSSR